MGKNRHSKDRIFITASEWANEYGGKKTQQYHGQNRYTALPFDYCALSLIPFEIPVILNSTNDDHQGVIFDLESCMEYILKHKTNPMTGEPASAKDIIRLNMAQTENG